MGSDLLPLVAEMTPRFVEREKADPESYPAQNIAELQAAGIINAPFAQALGGKQCSLQESVAVIESIAQASPSTALVVSMPLGLAGILGSRVEAPAAQSAAWASQVELVAGDYRAGKLYAACNSERGASGSLAATKTSAARDAAGRFLLTGEKILASSGRYARYFFSTAKVDPADLPGCGIVELFFVETDASGVDILDDWDGFGMRSTESQTVRYTDAPAHSLMGFPDFLALVQPLPYWFCMFAAIPLGCAATILHTLATPAPQSPAMRLRLSEAAMRYEALRAYLMETAGLWRPGAGPAYAARVLRTKTYVTQEATKLSAELFALGGGRHYTRTGRLSLMLADSFAGTALRPPLGMALEALVEDFSLPESLAEPSG